MTTTDLKPGPDLDAAVAKACGGWIAPQGTQYPSLHFGGGKSYRPPDSFSPSTDLNAAFEAAEKVGLFDSLRRLGKESSSEWCVLEYDCDCWMIISRAPTPALAICAAILSLEGAK